MLTTPHDISSLRAAFRDKLGDNDFYPNELEQRFQRIIIKIMLLWGEPELDDYLNELILPSRPGRKGFPHEVAAELFALSRIHTSTLCARQKTKPIANWGNPSDYTLLEK